MRDVVGVHPIAVRSEIRSIMPTNLHLPAPGSTIVGDIVERIRALIVGGDLPAGTQLVEVALADQFGVSRGPIREAIRRLQLQGLVELRPRRSAVVRTLAAEDVLEVYVLRSALGTVAIRHLIGAGLADAGLIARLNEIEEGAPSMTEQDMQSLLVRYDLDFQSSIVNWCGLPRVIAGFSDTTDQVRLFISTSGIEYLDIDGVRSKHASLLSRIVAKDIRSAVEVWRGQILNALDEFLELIPNGKQLAEVRPWLRELI